MLNIKRIDHVLNTTVYSMTNTVPLIHLVRHRQLKFLGHILRIECQRKSLLEDMLCTFKPLARGDLVDHVLHTLIMYKDCLGIMKEQCKNSRLSHLLMIVVHGETLRSPAPQPMDDDDQLVNILLQCKVCLRTAVSLIRPAGRFRLCSPFSSSHPIFDHFPFPILHSDCVKGYKF